MNFEIPLIEEKVKTNQITALHIMCAITYLVVGVFCWLFYGVAVHYNIPAIFLKWNGTAMLVAGKLLFVVIIFRHKWLIQPKVSRVFRVIEMILFLYLLVFTANQKLWVPTVMFGILCAALLFAIFWEGAKKQVLFVTVSADGIQLPATSRRREIKWQEVEQVLLRFGILTINCMDDYLFQWNTATTTFDAKTFEDFCTQQIETAKDKRTNNNW
jgi:uncharacterized protein with PQ loop repeat